MIQHATSLPIDRFVYTLDIVAREGKHLAYSWERLYSHQINATWVSRLEEKPENAEQLEAFVSRFGRMQDTIADKLLPRWLAALAETPGSMIETLNRAERLGVVKNVEIWLEARKLRNRLVHEYIDDAEQFSTDLGLAREYTSMLLESYNRIRDFAIERMELVEPGIPTSVALPDTS